MPPCSPRCGGVHACTDRSCQRLRWAGHGAATANTAADRGRDGGGPTLGRRRRSHEPRPASRSAAPGADGTGHRTNRTNGYVCLV